MIIGNHWKLSFEYDDVTMTGSLANYTWSKFSDVDLHIVF